MVKLREFPIQKAIAKHGIRYDYSNVVYVNAKTKVEIGCSIHGIFLQTPDSHLRESGCPKCGDEARSKKRSCSIEQVKEKIKEIHGDTYSYNFDGYINGESYISIICSKHGEFKQKAKNHIAGNKCVKCNNEKASTSQLSNNDEFKEKIKLVHGDRYDYSLLDYINAKRKVKIICRLHGIFEQTPNKHLSGENCPICADISRINKRLKTTGEFILKGDSIHNYRYDYSDVVYTGNKNTVKIICALHGVFEQTPDAHLANKNCPKCNSNISKRETEVVDYIKSIYDGNIITSDKKILNPKHLDIYLPDLNIAIEFDGLYWHNELKKPISYHLDKTKACQSKGIQLIHIFEDEWMYKRDIVKSMIKNKLGLIENKIYARKCIIKEVNIKESKEFLDNNHLQGNVVSQLKLGLYYNDTLVSLMTFNEPRKANSNEGIKHELTRFCNKIDVNIIGGASKLFKHFITYYKEGKTISYADLRWSKGYLYEKLGFKEIHRSRPDYFYVIDGRRYNKSGFRKEKLIKRGFDCKKSEHEIMLENGIYRIYDCGKIRFEYNK